VEPYHHAPHTAWWHGETQGQRYICKFFLRLSNSNCINYISEHLFSLFTFTHECKPTCCKTTKFPYMPAHHSSNPVDKSPSILDTDPSGMSNRKEMRNLNFISLQSILPRYKGLRVRNEFTKGRRQKNPPFFL
jgi:hypothetical protein